MHELTQAYVALCVLFCTFALPVTAIIIFLKKTNALREKDLSKPAVICTSIHGAYNLLVLLAVTLYFIGLFTQKPHASLANDPGAALALLAVLLIIVLGIPSAGIGIPTGVLNTVLSVSCIKKPETKKKGIICTTVSAVSFLISCGCMGIALWIIGWV